MLEIEKILLAIEMYPIRILGRFSEQAWNIVGTRNLVPARPRRSDNSNLTGLCN